MAQIKRSTESLEDRFMTTKHVSEFTGLAISTIQNWRVSRRNIPFYRIGKTVRYRLSDLMAFMDFYKVDPLTAEEREEEVDTEES